MTDEAEVVEDDTINSLFEEESEESESPKVEEETPEVTVDETESKEEETTEPTSDKEEAKTVPIAALLDERQKRQQLEGRLEELEKQLPQKDEAPDPITDPDDYESYIRTKVEKEFNDKAANEYTEKVNASRSIMLETEADYVDMEKIFMIMTTTDDTLATQMNASADPAKFAYDAAKTYRDSLLKPEVAETITDIVESPTETRNKSAVAAPSIASATAQTSNTTPVEKDESLNEMFADQKY